MSEKVVELKTSLHKHEKTDKELISSNQAIKTLLTPDNEQVVLNDQFSNLLIQIMKKRVDHGISIATVIPHKNLGISAVTETSRIKEQVPGTSVSSIRLNLKGSYTSYEELASYIKDLRTLPVSVVNLKVENRDFELGLRVYGN